MPRKKVTPGTRTRTSTRKKVVRAEAGSRTTLRRKKASRSIAAATIILEFPPQHFGEQAFLDATGPEIVSDDSFPETTDGACVVSTNVPVSNAEPVGALPAARMRMAGSSRLTFTMPDEVNEVGLGYEEIIDACREWQMRLSVIAAPDRNRRSSA